MTRKSSDVPEWAITWIQWRKKVSCLNPEIKRLMTPAPQNLELNSADIPIKKFYESIKSHTHWDTGTLAFEQSIHNKKFYPCISTTTLLEKSSDLLKREVAKVKIMELTKIG